MFLNKKKKILFINDTSDDNNLGCKATTNALYELINERVCDNFFVGEVITLWQGNRAEVLQHIPLLADLVDDACRKWVAAPDNSPVFYEVNKIRNADVVFINGEGSIYRDALKGKYLLFLAYLSKVFLNKPVYIVNHTAELSLMNDFAKKIYPVCDGVVVREPWSKREIEKHGIKNVLLAPDAVLKYSAPKNLSVFTKLPFGFDLNKKFIIVGGSSLNKPCYERWNGKWDKDLFKKFVKKLRDFTGMQILLLDVGGDEFLRELTVLRGVFYLDPNYVDYMFLSKLAMVHISGRHHGSLLASLAGCPVIGFTANTHKIEGDFELIGNNFPVFDFYKLYESSDDIVRICFDVLNNRDVYSEGLSSNILELKKQVYLNVDIIIQ